MCELRVGRFRQCAGADPSGHGTLISLEEVAVNPIAIVTRPSRLFLLSFGLCALYGLLLEMSFRDAGWGNPPDADELTRVELLR